MFSVSDEPEEIFPAMPGIGGRREFAGYEIIGELGRGGMGIVFKARQKNPDRLVALKVIAAGELASPRMLARFQMEAKTAAGLEHPNIVPLFEVGESQGCHYFSMQLIEGPTLGELLKGGPLAPERAVRLLLAVARAVEHAHQRAILHRDLKPNNIVIDPAGEPRLTDFGLAKAIEQESDLTLSCACLGTPAYMSPEQAAGRNREITTATDVYGLGAIFYEMLAGRPPFGADSAPVLLRKVMEEDPVPPSKVRASDPLRSRDRFVPRELELICLKCLEKDPARRYDTAGDLADELERWLRHEPIRAHPATMVERLAKWVRRQPALAGLLAMLVVAGTVVSAGAWRFTVHLERARRQAEERVRENLAQLVDRHVHDSASLAAHGDALRGLQSLVEALRVSQELPEREEMLRLRLGLTVAFAPGLLHAWDAGGSPADLEFSPDGTQLLVTLLTRELRILRMDGGDSSGAAEEQVLTARRYSSDGRRWLELSDTAPYARIRDSATGASVNLALGGPAGWAGAINANGSLAMTGGRELWIWNGGDGTPRARLADVEAECVWAGFGPDGRRLLTLHSDERARLWDVETGKLVSGAELSRRFGGYFEPVFSPDGSMVLLADSVEGHVRDLATFERRGTLMHPGVIFAGAFSPDGGVLATASFTGGARVWDAEQLEPMQPQLSHENGARCVAFSPDGRILATGGFDYQVRLWRRRDRRQMGPALPHDALVVGVTFSPDGRLLATASASGLVRVWGIGERPRVVLGRGAAAPAVFSRNSSAFAWPDNRDGWQLFRMKNDDAVAGERIPAAATALIEWDTREERVAVAAGGGGVEVREVATGAIVETIPMPGAVRSMAFSPDGSRLAVCGAGGWAAVARLGREEPLRLLEEADGEFLSIAWSREGRRIATGESGQVRLWDAETLRPVGEPIVHAGDVVAVRFSPDGKRGAAGFTDALIEPRVGVIFDAEDGRVRIPVLQHADGVRDVLFSGDGKIVATLGEDNTARLWHAESGLPASSALRHEAMVTCAAFSPGDRLLVTGSNDHRVRIWEVATGELVGPPLLLSQLVTSIGFTPGGGAVLAGAADGSLWRVTLVSDDHLLEDAIRYAVGATAHRRDPRAGLIPALPAVTQREVALLAGRAVSDVAGSIDTGAWHSSQAAIAEAETNGFAALFHLGRMLSADPGDEELVKRIEAAREQAENQAVLQR